MGRCQFAYSARMPDIWQPPDLNKGITVVYFKCPLIWGTVLHRLSLVMPEPLLARNDQRL